MRARILQDGTVVILKVQGSSRHAQSSGLTAFDHWTSIAERDTVSLTIDADDIQSHPGGCACRSDVPSPPITETLTGS